MVWQSVLGCGVFIGLAWVMSENRRRVNLRLLGTGVLLSFAAALVLMKVPVMRDGFMLLNRMVSALQASHDRGDILCFRLPRRGTTAFRRNFSRQQLHSGVPGPAHGAPDERLVLASVFLEIVAGRGPGALLGASQDHADRRGGGPVELR